MSATKLICLVLSQLIVLSLADASTALVPTIAFVSRDSDYTQACADEFGSAAVVADWISDISTRSDAQMQAVYSDLNIQPFANRYLVLKNGSMVCNEGVCIEQNFTRKYFIERHDGNPPGNWASDPHRVTRHWVTVL